MNSYNVIQAQAKNIKSTFSTSRGRVAVNVWFQGAKNRPAKIQELNSLMSNSVQYILKQKKCTRSVYMHDSVLEEDP